LRIIAIGGPGFRSASFPKSFDIPTLFPELFLSNDERSWVTAAHAAARIKEIENANEYLSRVDKPYLQERKKQILSQIENARGK